MSNERNIKDAAKQVVTALPAANANVTSAAIDLEQLVGGDLDNIVVELSVPATDSLVDTKAITFKFYDGATTTLAVTDPLIQSTVVGTSGNVSAAKVVRFRLPPNTKRYIGINAAVPSDGGNVTDVSFTVSLLF